MTRLIAVVSIATLALGGGCGDSDDAATEAVTLEVFQREVNSLCEQEHVRVDEMFEGFPDEPTVGDMQSLIGAFAESFRDYRDGLVDIGPPDGQGAKYEEYLELVEVHLEKLDAGAADPDEAERLFNEGGEDPFGDLERELGLDVCASR